MRDVAINTLHGHITLPNKNQIPLVLHETTITMPFTKYLEA